jgi:hypothetical protein
MGRLDKVESELYEYCLGIKMMIQNNTINQVATNLDPMIMARATTKPYKGRGQMI